MGIDDVVLVDLQMINDTPLDVFLEIMRKHGYDTTGITTKAVAAKTLVERGKIILGDD